MKRLNIVKQWKLNKEIRRKGSLIHDVDEFIERCQAYFDWCDRAPWTATELVKYQGSWDEAEVPLGRHYSVDELCTYLGVTGSYFRAYKKQLKERIDDKRADDLDEDRLAAIEFVENHIRAQNIGGAVVGVFKENIIARYHNIAENTNTHTSGESVLKITVRDQATADALKDLDDIL